MVSSREATLRSDPGSDHGVMLAIYQDCQDKFFITFAKLGTKSLLDDPANEY